MAHAIIALINYDKCAVDSGDAQAAIRAKHGENVCVWFRPERDMGKALLDEIKLEKIVEMIREQVNVGPHDSYTVKYLFITVDI